MKIIKILIILLFLTAPCIALADDEIKFVPQIGIPGEDSKFKAGTPYTDFGNNTQPIGEYISSIYSYAVAIVGILAACTLILGGLLWLTAGGSAERVTSAKSWIGSSLTGLLLVICSYLLLSMVNPNLVKFQISGIEKPKTESSGYVLKYDSTTSCGVYNDQTGQCGTLCPEGQTCKTAEKSAYSELLECPTTLNGNGNYWKCFYTNSIPSSCCTGNDGSQCGSDFTGLICNMGSRSVECLNAGKYSCTTKQNEPGMCDEQNDCNNGFYCLNKRCYDGSVGDPCDLVNDKCTGTNACQDCVWPIDNKCGSCL